MVPGFLPWGRRVMQAPLPLVLPLFLLVASKTATVAGDGCRGCSLAFGSYYVTKDTNLTFISQLFGLSDYRDLAKYNRGLPNLDNAATGDRVDVPFPCKCLTRPSHPASTYLAASIPYKVATGETYVSIASNYNNLTTADWLQATNTYPPNDIPDVGVVNITVNCSCGDARISTDYGLFRTFPLRDWETLASVAATRDLSSPERMDQLRRYNPGMEGVTGSGIVYIPAQDPYGSYLPLKSPAGKKVSAGAIAGSVVAGVVAPVLLVLFFLFYKRRKAKQNALLPSSKDSTRLANTILMQKVKPSTAQADVASLAADITVDKSVEFTYQELFNATEGFNITHKIGQGGFGAVYYAELKGEDNVDLDGASWNSICSKELHISLGHGQHEWHHWSLLQSMMTMAASRRRRPQWPNGLCGKP